jgi:hypothetical protein
MVDKRAIHEGMTVRTSDGARIGNVAVLGEDSFEIERGILSLEALFARYDEVRDVRGREIVLDRAFEEMRGGRGLAKPYPEVPSSEEAASGAGTERGRGDKR